MNFNHFPTLSKLSTTFLHCCYALTIITLGGCSLWSKRPPSSAKNASFSGVQLFPPLTKEENTPSFQGLSGLVFHKEQNNRLYFWSLTDRGPNLEPIEWKGQLARPFLEPSFNPHIFYFSIEKPSGLAHLEQTISLTDGNGKMLVGLPPQDRCTSEERPIDGKGIALQCALLGIDPESLGVDKQGNFWIGEEYGPSLLQFSPSGRLLKIYSPSVAKDPQSAPSKLRGPQRFDILPRSFADRKPNRGFEALAISGHTLYAMLQSPLPKTSEQNVAHHIPIAKIDIEKNLLLGVLWYPINSNDGEKIGDMSLENEETLLIVEQNSKIGAHSIHRIYRVKVPSTNQSQRDASPLTLKKELAFDLVREGYDQFEKVEGLSVISPEQIAVVNDNDFGVNPSKDFVPRTVLAIFSKKGTVPKDEIKRTAN